MRLLGIVMLLVLVGCGGGSAPTAEGIAKKMALPDSTTLRVTGDNDPNHLLGRSGGYTSKVSISVPEKRCAKVSQECGVEVEVFDSSKAAQDRADYIKAITQSSALFGSEYDTVRGTALLRVHGDVKPAAAKGYASKFKKAAS